MSVHTAFEDLAFAAIDFALTPVELAEFEGHLSGCEACRGLWQQVRADQAVLREISVVPSPSRVRVAVLDAATRTRPRRQAWQLVALAALLILALGLAVIGVGALRQRLAEDAVPLDWESVSVGSALAAAEGSVILTDVAFGGGRYVLLNDGTAGPRVAWSTNGREWQAGSWPDSDAELADVIHLDSDEGDPGFAIVGALAGKPTVWWSSNGAAWLAEMISDEPGSAIGIAALDGVVIVVGETIATIEQEGLSEEGIVPAAWRRAGINGSTWTPVSIAVDPASGAGFATVAPTSDGFVAVTADGSALESIDGDRWMPIASTPLDAQPAVLAWGDGQLVIVANQHPVPTVYVLGAEDWSDPIPLPGAASAIVQTVTYRGGRFVAGGSGPAGAVSWTSANGTAWTGGQLIDGGSAALINDFAWGPGQLLAIGARGNTGAIWIGQEDQR